MSLPNNPEQASLTEINERLYKISAEIFRYALGGYDVHGQVNILDEPAVYLPTHRSMWDIPAVGLPLLDAGHDPVRFIAKKELWDFRKFPVPGLSWWMNHGGALPVTRPDKHNREGARMDEVKQFLKVGQEDVVIFGEGGRKTGHRVWPVYGGTLLIASRLERPVVPVGIAGTKPLYRGKTQVVFGEPIRPEEVTNLYRNRKRYGLEGIQAILQVVYDEAYDQLQHTV